MPMTYFKKELPVRSPLYHEGEPIKFDYTDQSMGYLATDNEGLIAALNTCIEKRRGGVLKSNALEYEEHIKKKQALPPSAQQSTTVWREEMGAGRAPDTIHGPVAIVEPAIEPPAPAPVQRTGPAQKPSVGKRPAPPQD